jgi:5'-3' exonuclease
LLWIITPHTKTTYFIKIPKSTMPRATKIEGNAEKKTKKTKLGESNNTRSSFECHIIKVFAVSFLLLFLGMKSPSSISTSTATILNSMSRGVLAMMVRTNPIINISRRKITTVMGFPVASAFDVASRTSVGFATHRRHTHRAGSAEAARTFGTTAAASQILLRQRPASSRAIGGGRPNPGVSLAAYYSNNNNRNGDNTNNGRPPKFLTADDLEARDSSAMMSISDGYEEDVDGMAANYNPEDWLEEEEKDAYSMDLGNEVDPNDRSFPRPPPPPTTTTFTLSNESISSQTPPQQQQSAPALAPPAPPPTITPSVMAPSPPAPAFKAKQKVEEIAEPLSPLSFLSIIADPDPIETMDDDKPNKKKTFIPSSTPARPLSMDDDKDNNEVFTPPSPEVPNNPVPKRTGGKMFEKDSDSTLSSDEFRSKYSYDDREINFPAMLADDQEDIAAATASFEQIRPAVESSRRQDTLFQLENDLKRLEEEIVTANNGVSFNVASYKQVSMALFGVPNESTSKATLEGMATSNILAKLILDHRLTKQMYIKLQKQESRAQQKSQKRQQERNMPSSSSSEQQQQGDSEPLMLVDTSSFIFRAYYSMPPMHRAIDGMPTSAVLGFCNMLNRMVLSQLLAGKQPRLVLCCDAPSPASGGPKTIRHEMYSEYKAHRQEAPMDLIPQFPFFRRAAQAYGMTWVEAPGYEADDVIASLSQKAMEEGLTVHIYSGDKDLMQLITNSTSTAETSGIVEMIDPMTTTHWDHDSVVEKWGVASHQLGDVLALAGDTADNIPGVPGIGPKIAAQLLQTFGTLEELLNNLDQVPQAKRREKLEVYRDQAILSQALVRLERELDWEAMLIDSPFQSEEQFAAPPAQVADMRMEVMNPDRILQFYDEMGFVTIKQRLMDRLKRQTKLPYSYKDDDTRGGNKSGGQGNGGGGRFRAAKKTEIPKPEDYESVPF